jgi:hypothetical protein
VTSTVTIARRSHRRDRRRHTRDDLTTRDSFRQTRGRMRPLTGASDVGDGALLAHRGRKGAEARERLEA